jgi:hypothetical protein
MADSLAKLPRNGRSRLAGFFDGRDQLALAGSVGDIDQRECIISFPRRLARGEVNGDRNSLFLHDFQRAALAALWLFHLPEVVINLSSIASDLCKVFTINIKKTASSPVGSVLFTEKIPERRRRCDESVTP